MDTIPILLNANMAVENPLNHLPLNINVRNAGMTRCYSLIFIYCIAGIDGHQSGSCGYTWR
jgi:hypothetical protein